MPVESCTQSLCDLALRFGEDSDEAGMVSGSCSMQTIQTHFWRGYAAADLVLRGMCWRGGGGAYQRRMVAAVD